MSQFIGQERNMEIHMEFVGNSMVWDEMGMGAVTNDFGHLFPEYTFDGRADIAGKTVGGGERVRQWDNGCASFPDRGSQDVVYHDSHIGGCGGRIH